MPIGPHKSAEFTAERKDWKSLCDGLPDEPLLGKRLPIFYETFSASKSAIKFNGGPSRDTLRNWENGTGDPRPSKLDTLFRAAKRVLSERECPDNLAANAAAWLARGSPPDGKRGLAGKKKAPAAPENTQETAEAVASTVSRETPCSPTPELRCCSDHLEQAERLLQEAAELLDEGSRLKTWPRDLNSRPVEQGAMMTSYPLSERWVGDWLILLDFGQNHPVLLLRHITEVLPVALAAIQKKRPDEHPAFLDWLLNRANQCFRVAEAEQGALASWLRLADEWLSLAQELLSVVESSLERPSSNLSLWKAAVVLREEIPQIESWRASLFFDEALYVGFVNRLKLLADDWARAYVESPRRGQVWLDGLIEEDPRGFSFILNDEESILNWVDAPPCCDWPAYLHPADSVDESVADSLIPYEPEWLEGFLAEAPAWETEAPDGDR